MNNKSKWYFYHTIWTIMLVIFICSGFYYLLHINKNNKSSFSGSPLPTRSSPGPTKSIESLEGKQFFRTNFPIFEKLTIEDLPDYSGYIRETYKYKNRLIISGAGPVIDYDPVTKEIIRLSSYKCGDATVIDTDLYVACVNEVDDSTVYKVSLETGIMHSTKITTKGSYMYFTNLHMTAHDKYLWGESWEWIFKYDTKNDRVKYYRTSELPFNCNNDEYGNCKLPDDIYVENDNLNVAEHNTESVVAYHYDTDQWSLTGDSGSYMKRPYKSGSDWGIGIPHYYAISQISHGKRYLFADNGFYSLTSNSFPEFLYSHSLSTFLNYYQDMYVDTENKHVLIVGQPYTGEGGVYRGNKVGDVFFVYLVNIQNGNITDAMRNSEHYYGDIKDYYPLLSSLGQHTEYKEDNGIVTVINSTNKRESFKVDLDTKSITYINLDSIKEKN